jgi:hypothetical protein
MGYVILVKIQDENLKEAQDTILKNNDTFDGILAVFKDTEY